MHRWKTRIIALRTHTHTHAHTQKLFYPSFDQEKAPFTWIKEAMQWEQTDRKPKPKPNPDLGYETKEDTVYRIQILCINVFSSDLFLLQVTLCSSVSTGKCLSVISAERSGGLSWSLISPMHHQWVLIFSQQEDHLFSITIRLKEIL